LLEICREKEERVYAKVFRGHRIILEEYKSEKKLKIKKIVINNNS